MDNFARFLPYVLVMAGMTYMIRILPLLLVKKKFENKYIESFIYYIPYAVLGVMTVPAIFYSTSSVLSAVIGFAVAVAVAFFFKSMVAVSVSAVGAVFVTELIMQWI